MRNKKIIPILCTSCSILATTPIITSCNTKTEEIQHIDSKVWKSAWKNLYQYDNRDFKISIACDIKLFINDEQIIDLPAVKIQYAAQKSESYFYMIQQEEERADIIFYSTLFHNYLWTCENPESSDPKWQPQIPGGSVSSIESAFVTIFAIMGSLNNLFVYDKANNTTTWKILNSDMLHLNWMFQFANNLISKTDIDANITLNDVPILGKVKLDIDMSADFDYTKQEWKKPAKDPEAELNKLTLQDGKITCTPADKSGDDYVFTLDSTVQSQIEGKNQIIVHSDSIEKPEDYNYTFSMYKNGKLLTALADDFIVQNDKITLAEPLKSTDVINFAISLEYPLYSEKPFSVTLGQAE